MNRKMMARILNADRDYAWLSNAYIADADDGVRVCVCCIYHDVCLVCFVLSR